MKYSEQLFLARKAFTDACEQLNRAGEDNVDALKFLDKAKKELEALQTMKVRYARKSTAKETSLGYGHTHFIETLVGYVLNGNLDIKYRIKIDGKIYTRVN